MEWFVPVPAAEVARRVADEGRKVKLLRCLGLGELVMFGLGKMVGAGVLVLLGVAAQSAGNGVPLCYLLAGLAALVNAACYGEFVARMPSCGSAYAYALL